MHFSKQGNCVFAHANVVDFVSKQFALTVIIAGIFSVILHAILTLRRVRVGLTLYCKMWIKMIKKNERL